MNPGTSTSCKPETPARQTASKIVINLMLDPGTDDDVGELKTKKSRELVSVTFRTMIIKHGPLSVMDILYPWPL